MFQITAEVTQEIGENPQEHENSTIVDVVNKGLNILKDIPNVQHDTDTASKVQQMEYLMETRNLSAIGPLVFMEADTSSDEEAAFPHCSYQE